MSNSSSSLRTNVYLPWLVKGGELPFSVGKRYTDGEFIAAGSDWPPGCGTSPRQVDSEAGHGVGLDSLLLDPSQVIVYRLDGGQPCGGEQVWEVAEVIVGLSLLGPQGEELVAAANLASALVADGDYETVSSGPLAGISLSADVWHGLQELYENGPADEVVAVEFGRRDRLAAGDALRQAGAVGDFDFVKSCANGDELLAIAARDLLSSVDGWDLAAYNRMTARYHRTVTALAEHLAPARLPGPIAAPIVQ